MRLVLSLPCHLDEDFKNLLGVVLVDTFDALDLLSVLEDDNSWEGLKLEALLAGWELFNVDLVGNGVLNMVAGSSFSGFGDLTSVGIKEDVLLLGLESFHELLLAAALLVSGLLDWSGNWDLWSSDGGHYESYD